MILARLMVCSWICFLNSYSNQNIKQKIAEELTSRVEELLSIRVSVLTELRVLERNRSVVIKQISERNNELEKLKTQIIKRAAELERLQLHIKQAALAQKEAKDQVGSLVEPPLDILPKQAQKAIFTNGNCSFKIS